MSWGKGSSFVNGLDVNTVFVCADVAETWAEKFPIDQQNKQLTAVTMVMQASDSLALLELPGELLLQVLSLLSIKDILTVRQTCTTFAQITQTSSLWLMLHEEQEKILRLPVKYNLPPGSQLSPPSLEPDVITTHRIAKSWTQPRISSPMQLKSATGGSLLEMEIFCDRWLCCVYWEGLVNLWDLWSPGLSGHISVSLPCRLPDMRSACWTSVTTALDDAKEHVVLALTHSSIPSITHIYRVNLPSSGHIDDIQFKLMRPLTSPVLQTARGIEPGLHRLILSSANTVNIVDINGGSRSPSLDMTDNPIYTMQTIHSRIDGVDELMNSIACSRIMGPYVVLFKTRSIELHLLKSDQPVHATSDIHNECIHRHHFTSISIRSFSISDHVVTHDRLTFSFIGCDFLRGLFIFDVSVCFTPTPMDASFDVNCIGMYEMADDTSLSALLPLPSLRSTLVETADAPSMASPPLLQLDHMSNVSSPSMPSRYSGIFGPTSGNSRGFISAMALGPQGKRAVWVERKHGSTIREVLVWSRGSELESQSSGRLVIPRNVVYRLKSYDLRKDLKHCAIGEVSGTIALGNRMGEIFVMGV